MSSPFDTNDLLDFLESVIAQNDDPETGDTDLLREAEDWRAMLLAPTLSGRCPFEGEHEHTSEDAADSLELEVEMVAVFSTIHMPSSYPNFGEVSFDEFPEGFWVYVGTPEGLSGVVVPEWLRPLVAACHARDIRRLVFDCDGPQYDEFPQYDWDASAVCDEKEGG